MRKEVLYTLASPYREELRVTGYHFGAGRKSACIVGAIRGNEIQQLYVCSQLVKTLDDLEKKKGIVPDCEILVIPSIGHHSMNIGKRFWPVDNTDVNRMFPGYDMGETTQRIAAGIFETVKHYDYGIQFASFYMPGDFVPHVRMMDTGFQNVGLADLFGMPYVVIRKPKPIDTTTLNYNWQLWETNAFSVYTSKTDMIDEKSARQAVASVLRFLMRMGILRYRSHNGYISTVVEEEKMAVVKTVAGGIYRRFRLAGEEVCFGEPLAEILHPYEGTVLETVTSTADGVIFFSHEKPLVTESEIVYKVIRHMHV